MRFHQSTAILMAIMFLSGCGSATSAVDIGAVPTSEVPDDEGGFGAPSQAAGEFDPVLSRYSVTGSLHLDAVGCWGVVLNDVERLAVLPVGFAIDGSDATTLVSPDGSTFRDGDAIDATVRFFQAGDVPGGVDGRWGNYLEVCRPTLPELAVIDDLAAAFDPAELSTEDHRRLIAEADFTEDWPCGRGWAISTADQHVGIVIYQLDDRQPSNDAPVGLPDSGWTADVIVGSFLFVNHCNDAVEEWMPEQTVVARLPLTGSVSIHDVVPAPSDPSSPVTATLEGASVDIDGDRLELPTIELRNEAYNFFAG